MLQKISFHEVEETIKFPTIQYKRYNKRFYAKIFQKVKIEIVTETEENNIKIIT
mgnify:CR=1 FL=1